MFINQLLILNRKKIRLLQEVQQNNYNLTTSIQLYRNQDQIMAFLISVFKGRKFGILRQLPSTDLKK